jgi:hypothetical protein
MMKPFSSKTVFLLPMLLVRIISSAQVFNNDDMMREARFVTKVVQLDEFIHRFNNDTSSEIRRYYLAHHLPWDKSRQQLIRSLFDHGSQNRDHAQVDHFIQRVTDPRQPDSIGFLRDKWYAEASCDFQYHETVVKADLILRIQVNPDGSAQWMITAVKPGFAFRADKAASPAEAPIIPIRMPQQKRRFIQPAANDTYFAELERDFADKRRLADLFDKAFFGRRFSLSFYEALLHDQIRFLAVRKLRYHYLQVHDWIFTVENFNRDTRPSGWLIASLREANDEQRHNYVKKLLGDPVP